MTVEEMPPAQNLVLSLDGQSPAPFAIQQTGPNKHAPADPDKMMNLDIANKTIGELKEMGF